MRLSRDVYLLAVLLGSVIGCFAESETNFSVLSPITEQDVALIVDVDGKFYLLDVKSRKMLWSWSSNLPIYSSYQNIPDSVSVFTNSTNSLDDYVDCGDDWELYNYRNGTQISKVPMSAEDYMGNAPISDRGVTVGLRKSMFFVVDAESGKLIRQFKSPDFPSNSGSLEPLEGNPHVLKRNVEEFVEFGGENSKEIEHLLYIKRVDYFLLHCSLINREILWSVSFAKIDASFCFTDFGNELGELHEIKPIIIRTRVRGLRESLSMLMLSCKSRPLPAPECLVAEAFSEIPIASESCVGGESAFLGDSNF